MEELETPKRHFEINWPLVTPIFACPKSRQQAKQQLARQQKVWVRRYVLPNRIQFGWTRTNEWLQYSDDQPPVVNFKEKRSITDLSANISTLHAQKKALIFMTKSCFCHKNSYKIIKHLCTKKHHGTNVKRDIKWWNTSLYTSGNTF